MINNANYVDYEDKRVHSYKLLRRMPETICCYLVPKRVCFHPSTLILEMEKESEQTVISWAVTAFIIMLKSGTLLKLLL